MRFNTSLLLLTTIVGLTAALTTKRADPWCNPGYQFTEGGVSSLLPRSKYFLSNA